MTVCGHGKVRAESAYMGKRSGLRAGVYVDVENTMRNGGRGMRFDVLRDYACRDGAEAIRLNAYLAFDEERAEHDAVEPGIRVVPCCVRPSSAT